MTSGLRVALLDLMNKGLRRGADAEMRRIVERVALLDLMNKGLRHSPKYDLFTAAQFVALLDLMNKGLRPDKAVSVRNSLISCTTRPDE